MIRVTLAEVENLVTINLEKKLWEIDGVEHVYSVSRPGFALVTVRFYVGEDRTASLVKIYNKIQSNIDAVPSGVSGWVVKPVEINDVPILTLTLYSATASDAALRRVFAGTRRPGMLPACLFEPVAKCSFPA